MLLSGVGRVSQAPTNARKRRRKRKRKKKRRKKRERRRGDLHRRLLSSTYGLLEFGRDGQQKIHQIPYCRKRQNP